MSSLLNENVTIALMERIFEIVLPMNEALQQSLRSLDIFKEVAFAEFENIRKEIRSVQEKDEFLVPKLPAKKGRTKGKITASNLSQHTSNESTLQIEPATDNTILLRKSNRTANSTILLKHASNESTMQVNIAADQTITLRRSNRTLVKNSQSISKQILNEKAFQNDPVSDQSMVLRKSSRQAALKLKSQSNELPNKSTCDQSEKLPEANVRSSRVLRNENSKRLSSSICNPLQAPRPSKVRKVNKHQKQVADSVQTVEISQDDKREENAFANKKGIRDTESKNNENVNKENTDQANKIEDNQTDEIVGNSCGNKPEDNHCEISASTVQFNEDRFSTSTRQSSCLPGKSKEGVIGEIKVINEGQNVPLLDEKNTSTHTDINDGVTKKIVDNKEDGILKDNTNKIVNCNVPMVKSQIKNSKVVDKENVGYNTPERMRICRVLSGSVKKKVEAFEKASKNVDCSPRIGTKDAKKNIERPMRITRNASKALNNAFNNNGSVPKLKESYLNALQEKANIVRNFEEKNNASKKKVELMKATVEEKYRKREEKGKRVLAQREAVEKEKLELALKLEKSKEEKFKKLQKEKEERIKEHNSKKKLLAAQKVRLAHLKEIEEDERRKAVIKQKLEHQKMRMQKVEEIRTLARKYKEQIKAMEQDPKEKDKDPDDYGANDMNAGDSTDDENLPKNPLPLWASMKYREHALLIQSYVPERLIQKWFHKKNDKKPDLATLFSSRTLSRPRTSSILWDSRVCFDNSTSVF